VQVGLVVGSHQAPSPDASRGGYERRQGITQLIGILLAEVNLIGVTPMGEGYGLSLAVHLVAIEIVNHDDLSALCHSNLS
jgi:hypothetical protein